MITHNAHIFPNAFASRGFDDDDDGSGSVISPFQCRQPSVGGLPSPSSQPQRERSWYDHAIDYVDMKWPSLQCGSRRCYAESLATVTSAIVRTRDGAPDTRTLFRALASWAFNKTVRESGPPPKKLAAAIEWIQENSLPLAELIDPHHARAAHTATLQSPGGKPFAPKTQRNKRQVLVGAISYALELGLLDRNPLDRIRSTAIRRTTCVDRRSVVNPGQARTLLEAVADQGRPGSRFVAFFAAMYFAALRPSEVMALRRDDCILPEAGWGWLLLEGASPYVGAAWTDHGTSHQRKSLKHREDGEVRRVPASPELVTHLRAHIEAFGVTSDGRLFRNGKGEPPTYSSYNKIWQAARSLAFSPAQVRSPLAKRPYDLRHAAVSTWLAAGVPAAQVAAWAGHDVKVLLDTYAKCLDGQEEVALEMVERALEPAPSVVLPADGEVPQGGRLVVDGQTRSRLRRTGRPPLRRPCGWSRNALTGP